MRKILTVAALMGGMLTAIPVVLADNNAASGMQNTGGSGLSEPMIVTVDNGNVREAPNPTAKILTMVPRGHQVTVVSLANGNAWAHVIVDGLNGYMDLVQLAKAPSDSYYATTRQGVRYMVVASDNGYIRQYATSDSAVLTALPQGTRVIVTGPATDGSWAHIQANGVDGYMDVGQLADTAPPAGTVIYQPSPAPSSSGYPAYQTYQTTPSYQPQPTYQAQPSYQPQPTYYQPYQPNPSYQPQTTYQVQPSYQQQPSYYQASPGYQTNPTYQTYYQTPAPAPTSSYTPTTRLVNSGGAVVRQTPDTQSAVVGSLPPGYLVSVVGSANGSWAHVVGNGLQGYVPYGQLQ